MLNLNGRRPCNVWIILDFSILATAWNPKNLGYLKEIGKGLVIGGFILHIWPVRLTAVLAFILP